MKSPKYLQRIYPGFKTPRLRAEQAGARPDDRQEFPCAYRARELPAWPSLLGDRERYQEGEAEEKKKEEPLKATTDCNGTAEEWKHRCSAIHPPRVVACKVKVHGIDKQGRILARAETHRFFSAGTATPDPSFRAWIASTGKSAKRSTRPLGQRISTHSIFFAVPTPKCTLISLLEM